MVQNLKKMKIICAKYKKIFLFVERKKRNISTLLQPRVQLNKVYQYIFCKGYCPGLAVKAKDS